MKNDLPAACDFQISLTINYESTWPGQTLHKKVQKNLLEFSGTAIDTSYLGETQLNN